MRSESYPCTVSQYLLKLDGTIAPEVDKLQLKGALGALVQAVVELGIVFLGQEGRELRWKL